METAFYVLVSSESSALLKNISLNLTPEKPVLVEDVESEWKALYLALEYVPLAQRVRFLDERRLLVCWSINFDFIELQSLVAPLLRAGAHVLIGAVRVEDGSVFLVKTSPEFSVIYEPIEPAFTDDDDLVTWLSCETDQP